MLGVSVQKSVYVNIRNLMTRKMHFCTSVQAVTKDEAALYFSQFSQFSWAANDTSNFDGDYGKYLNPKIFCSVFHCIPSSGFARKVAQL